MHTGLLNEPQKYYNSINEVRIERLITSRAVAAQGYIRNTVKIVQSTYQQSWIFNQLIGCSKTKRNFPSYLPHHACFVFRTYLMPNRAWAGVSLSIVNFCLGMKPFSVSYQLSWHKERGTRQTKFVFLLGSPIAMQWLVWCVEESENNGQTK